MAILEIACFKPDDALIAEKAGADRIELCDDRESGGITPQKKWVMTVKSAAKIPVFVMIRPRKGDFCYSDADFESMKSDLRELRGQADGFVFGILTADRKVDVMRASELVQQARPLPCTFHRAFDETPDLFEALEDVIRSGCSAILTSGGKPSALLGREYLRQLAHRAQDRIAVIPGGGVRSTNIPTLQMSMRATVFHSSGIIEGSSTPSFEEIQRMKTLNFNLGKSHDAGAIANYKDPECAANIEVFTIDSSSYALNYIAAKSSYKVIADAFPTTGSYVESQQLTTVVLNSPTDWLSM
ncbi:hypothetical protein MMC25_002992 [Agyrium rufum]|nr:hypothetical protein [Agyrium rufum]